MPIKLSIIVPMYKSEWCISDCITSLYKQDLPLDDYEVLAVDNGSPDGCAEYIRTIQKKYFNLRLISLFPNCLPSGARNAGMDAAKGKYIMFVDSDDMLKPNVIGTLLEEMENDNLDFLHFVSDLICDGKIVERENSKTTPVVDGIDLLVDELIPIQSFDVTWGKIYNTQFLRENELHCTEGLLYEDTEFAYRIFAAAKRVKHTDFVPYLYRFNEGSATQNHCTYKAIKSDILCINKMIEDVNMFRKQGLDVRFIKIVETCLRWTIHVVFTNYCKYQGPEKKMLFQMMRQTFTWRCLPYMSKKKFILLKLGIIR